MDRRSFMLGLAASTAAVPIAKLAVPALVSCWHNGVLYVAEGSNVRGVMYEVGELVDMDLRPGAINRVYRSIISARDVP